MIELAPLAMAGVAGLLLGVVFFGGLWLTVNRGAASQRAALWFFGSFLLRTSVVICGFYLVSGGQWEQLLTCLAGFVVARHIVLRGTRLPDKFQDYQPGQANRAP